MRLSTLTLSSLFHTNTDRNTKCEYVNFGAQRKSLSSPSSYEFNYCSWEDCLGEPGGAISCSSAVVSLSVSHCIFTRCNSTSYENPNPQENYNGGAISVNGIDTFILSSSVFLRCCAPQATIEDGGAGGVYAYAIQTTLSLSSSEFISGFSGSSGGGAQCLFIHASDVGPQTVNSCRFIHCIALGYHTDGGGLCIWQSTFTLGCSNCLFSECITDSGGGLEFSYDALPDEHPLHFVFFNRNRANVGNDICIYYDIIANSKLFFCCFSTTTSSRVGFWTSLWNSNIGLTHDDWFTSGTVVDVWHLLVDDSG